MAKLVRFTRDHDHMCPSRATIAYKRGMELLVPGHIAEALPLDAYEPVQKKGRRRG